MDGFIREQVGGPFDVVRKETVQAASNLGRAAVVILTTDAFDATTIDPLSVRFGPLFEILSILAVPRAAQACLHSHAMLPA